MSNLSSLYISGSYKGLINLNDSTKGFNEQSNPQLEDGLGTPIGISVQSGSSDVILSSSLSVGNTLTVANSSSFNGQVTVNDSMIVTDNLSVTNNISSSTVSGIGNVTLYSASVDLRLDDLESTSSIHDNRVEQLEIYTSSLKDAFEVSGTNTEFLGNITVSGSITARTLYVIEESASVIFSSGSNVLGDEASDIQTLNGTVNIPNLEFLAGNPTDTNTRINQKLDSGSFLTYSSSIEVELNTKLDNTWTSSVYTPFSQSVDTRLNSKLDNSWTSSVFTPFSTSVDYRLDLQENFSSSLVLNFVTDTVFNDYTTLTDTRLDNIELTTQSLDNSVSLINAFTASVTQSITDVSSSLNSRVDVLSSYTGSYATTGSNVFLGDEVISGSLKVSGSTELQGGVYGNITPISSSGTVNLDLSEGNFFDVQLVVGSNYFTATNAQVGQNVIVKCNLPGGLATATFATSSFLFPRLAQPVLSDTDSGVDILTFVTLPSLQGTQLYGIINNDFTTQI